MLGIILEESIQNTSCQGVKFRYSCSVYKTGDGGYYKKESIKKLKRISCSGCIDCGWVDEAIDEYISYNDEIPVLGPLVDGDIVEYVMQGSTDYWGEWSVDEEGFVKIDGYTDRGEQI